MDYSLLSVSLQDKNVPIKSEEDNTKTVITLDRQDIILNKNKVEEMGKKALEKSTTKVEEKIYEEIKKLVK